MNEILTNKGRSFKVKLNSYSEMVDKYSDELIKLLSKFIGKELTNHDVRTVNVINNNKIYRARINIVNNSDVFGILEYYVGKDHLNLNIFTNSTEKDDKNDYNKISSDIKSIIFNDEDELDDYILTTNHLQKEVLKDGDVFYGTIYNNGYKKIYINDNDKKRHEYTYDKTKNKLTHEVFKK